MNKVGDRMLGELLCIIGFGKTHVVCKQTTGRRRFDAR